jgi:hypothetical protein
MLRFVRPSSEVVKEGWILHFVSGFAEKASALYHHTPEQINHPRPVLCVCF